MSVLAGPITSPYIIKESNRKKNTKMNRKETVNDKSDEQGDQDYDQAMSFFQFEQADDEKERRQLCDDQ